jgi:hypothetical protein
MTSKALTRGCTSNLPIPFTTFFLGGGKHKRKIDKLDSTKIKPFCCKGKHQENERIIIYRIGENICKLYI